MSFFLTGTDTNAGKTYVAALLIRALRKQGIDCVGMKPICCGSRADAELLHQASGGNTELNRINPVWLRTPAAPYVASMIENRPIDLALIRESFAALRAEHACVAVEGIGGWMVPIEKDYFVGHLAREMGLPVIVVVANKLGAINHAVLTVRAVRIQGLTCAGIILNDALSAPQEETVATTTNRAVLETLLEVPILLEIRHGQEEADVDAALVRALSL
jgi:dethiobiotin synthetase